MRSDGRLMWIGLVGVRAAFAQPAPPLLEVDGSRPPTSVARRVEGLLRETAPTAFPASAAEMLTSTDGLPCGFGDGDRNGTIDLFDLAGLRDCFAALGDGSPRSGCHIYDADGDGRVDLQDWAAFQCAYTGPHVASRLISGVVYDHRGEGGGVGVGGVDLFLRGTSFSGRVCTRSDGTYNVRVPDNWCGSVRPGDLAWAFDPDAGNFINLHTDSEQDFVANVALHRISGSIFRSDGQTLAAGREVKLVFTDEGGRFLTAVRTSNGRYRANLPPTASRSGARGTVSARGMDVEFENETLEFHVDALNARGPDFIAYYVIFVDDDQEGDTSNSAGEDQPAAGVARGP